MKNKSHSHAPHEPSDADIQHTAYYLWIAEGRPVGRDVDHWLAAREMLRHSHGRDASTGRRSAELATEHRHATSHS